ncbi:chromate efflux transporter [Algirhabdus cladophorae]|uniref:chromate efflux transporter n=1 Tax=Algirhabdus cladophorae TaxID=3377108 RepID=UPI003B846468
MTTLTQATKVFAKIGCLSFGGPAAQIALMHSELVERHQWLSEKQFLSGLSFCMLLPGPEAMQLATYAGWRMHGVRGGLIAGGLFVLPGALVIFALATLYALFGSLDVAQSLFIGIKAAVLAVVIQALTKVAKKAFKTPLQWGLAACSFVALFVFNLPFPLVIAVAAGIGFFATKAQGGTASPLVPLGQTIKTVAFWLALWLVPIAVLDLVLGQAFLSQIATFFATLAAVTFGGAYAVLAYMAQEVVQNYGWLTAGQMIDSLGLAETTPGPLILVTQFVGFMAGFAEAGLGMAFVAGLITLWVTFIPCFLWIFAAAPYVEWISAQPRLSGALTAITATVVGVIANLSLWFALHVLFNDVSRTAFGWVPSLSSLNWLALGLSLLSCLLVLRFNWNILWVLALSAGLAVVLA